MKDNTNMIEITITFTQEEYALIENAARRHGMTVDEFLHYAVTCGFKETKAS